MSGLRVALVRVDGDNWQDGTLIGTGVLEPRPPYAYVKDLPAFLAWARFHEPSKCYRGFLDYGWVRDVLRAFTEGPEYVTGTGEMVPFVGLALAEGQRMRFRVSPVDGVVVWESPLDVVPGASDGAGDGPGGDGCGTGDILTLLGGEAS